MINPTIKVILKIISFIFIIWCIYNYDKFYNRYRENIKRKLFKGDNYIEEINRLTGYKDEIK